MKKFKPLFSEKLNKPAQDDDGWQSKVLPAIWRGLKRVCMALGVMVLISGLIWGYALSQLFQPVAPPILPQKMVLYLNLEGDVRDTPSQSSLLNPFEPVAPTLRTIVETINAAAKDDRVKGLYVRMDDVHVNLSQAQEIRAAVKRFKDAGKFTTIYAASYGGGMGGLAHMYLAAAFDQRWMQPMGVVSIEGLRAEMPFFRPVLDKLGIKPEFFQREEYKTAYESFTNRTISEAGLTVLTDVVDSIREAIMADMPDDLGMEPAQLQSLIDTGLLTASESLQGGLITHVDYADNLVDGLKEEWLGSAESEESLFVSLNAYAADYRHARRHYTAKKPVVALVYAVGAIMDSNESKRDGIAAAEDIAPAILDAAEDDRVKAILLRVDSPGGSPVASETILRAVQKAKAKGKPVIVSMGSMAASGGYWISSGADYIFAMPTTLTGSIGVVGGKASGSEMWDKIGVNWNRSVQWGDNAGLWSFNTAFTPDQQARFEAMLDSIYSAFLQRVADGRGMSLEAADDVARGRVWPGLRAVDNGLVDELGGLNEALDYTAQLLERESADDVRVVQMPRPQSPLERFVNLLAQQGLVFEGLRLQGQVMEQVRPYVETMGVISADPVMAYESLRVQ